MKHIKLSILLFPILLFVGCKGETEFNELSTEVDAGTSDEYSNRIDARTFIVTTPQDWNLYEDSGTDTYIGRIAGPEDTIYFDQGYLSFGSLENIDEDENTLFFQRLEVDQIPSILHKEKRVEDLDGDMRLSIYIDAGDKTRLNRLYVFDPKDEEKIIKIFKSHRFK